MDWSKAKTILIVSFIIVNMMLGISLANNKQGLETNVSMEFVDDSIRLLSNKNISVATEVPREVPSLNSLIVEYEIYKTSELNKRFFNEEGSISSKGEGIVEIQHNNQKLTVLNNKQLIFESYQTDPIYDLNTEDDALKIATDFLIKLNYDISDMKLSHVKKLDNRYYIEFSKIYDERYLESAFTNIQLDNSGVIELKRLWLNVIEVGEIPIFIGSAPKSILGLLSMNEVYGRTIKDISLCYYFNPEKHEYIQNPLEAKQGKTIPAWRIQFEDGYKVFIDNY